MADEPKRFYVYILASRRRGALYIGVTSNLARRIWEHKTGIVPGHSARYQIDKLVYVERHDSAEAAITREKQLKKWLRAWKIELIEEHNPSWRDLYGDVLR